MPPMLAHCVVKMQMPDTPPTLHGTSELASLPIVMPPSEPTRFGLRIAVNVFPS
jgi:hypothetical protein